MDHFLSLLTKYDVHIDRVVETVLLLMLASVCILYLTRFVRKVLLQVQAKRHISYETMILLTRLTTVALWVTTGILLLSFWGISVTGLWTLIVSVSAVIGVGFLAVWTMVSNITANFFITIWHPFPMGATVEMLPENLKGRVIDRNMMFTILREESGSALFIPNNLFFQKMFRVSHDNEQHLFEFLERQKNTIKPPPSSPSD